MTDVAEIRHLGEKCGRYFVTDSRCFALTDASPRKKRRQRRRRINKLAKKGKMAHFCRRVNHSVADWRRATGRPSARKLFNRRDAPKGGRENAERRAGRSVTATGARLNLTRESGRRRKTRRQRKCAFAFRPKRREKRRQPDRRLLIVGLSTKATSNSAPADFHFRRRAPPLRSRGA